MFCSKIVVAAPRVLPEAIWAMNLGMSIVVGQCATHGAS